MRNYKHGSVHTLKMNGIAGLQDCRNAGLQDCRIAHVAFCKRTYKILLFFPISFFLQFSTQAQSPAMVYADSMMQTPAGDTMYSQFMADPQTEDTSVLSEEHYAYQATMNYFMEEIIS